MFVSILVDFWLHSDQCWISGQVYDKAIVLEILVDEQVDQVLLELLVRELEILILGVGQDVVQETGESDQEFSHKSTDQENTVLISDFLSNVVNFVNLRTEFLLFTHCNDLVLNDIL